MQSDYYPTNETTTTSERPPPISPTTSTQHGIESLVPFDAGPRHEEGGCSDSTSQPSTGRKGKGREVFDVISSDDEDRSLPGSEPPISPGERIRIYESNYAWNSELSFAVHKRDVSGMGYSLIDNVPNEIIIHALAYLDPLSLSSMALVSKRFSGLVSSPHVWRSAFLRFFPGSSSDACGPPSVAPVRPYFTRLTINSTWKKEYILRTSLLRSFAKGKALDMSARSVKGPKGSQSLMITYDAKCNNITHISVRFPNTVETGGAKALPRLYSGSTFSDVVSISDYTIGKPERALWQRPGHFPPDFLSSVPGANRDYFCPNNLGSGVMDLSEGLGWVFGETIPNGNLYVFAHYVNDNLPSAQSGFRMARPLQLSTGGFVDGNGLDAGISSVWIAKARRAGTILDTSEGKIGVLSGSSKGCLSVFSLPKANGLLSLEDWNVAWASWYICPGVPILSVNIDNDYSTRRKRGKAPWCVIVNAIGEIWYSTTLPTPDANSPDWQVIPTTLQPKNRRQGSSGATARQHTEELLLRDWRVLREMEPLWGNDWWIEVDWADDSIIRGRKLLGSTISRFHRTRLQPSEEALQGHAVQLPQPSIFGDGSPIATPDSQDIALQDAWLTTTIEFSETPGEQHLISAIGLDNSYLCQVSTADRLEDDIPGSNARLFAIGTDEGTVFVWNMREFHHSSSIYPLRRIQTLSPKITTVAVSSLLVVSGGNDGLVVAYDPLSSSTSPVRVIHSRLTSRARRRLAQLPDQNAATCDNQYAARACVLDPEPTSLRGVIALGAYIRHWSIASDSSDNSARRRKRKLARQALATSRPRTKTSSNSFQGLIRNEVNSLKKEALDSDRENDRLEGRFGISYRMPGANDLTEEELLAYAELLSKEAYSKSQSYNGFDNEAAQISTSFGSSESSSRDSEDETFAKQLDAAIAASLAADTTAAAVPFSLDEPNGESSNSLPFGHCELTGQRPDGDTMDEDLRLALRLSMLDC